MTLGRCRLSIFCSRGTPHAPVDVMNQNPLSQPTSRLSTAEQLSPRSTGDPTVGLCLGPYSGPSVEAVSYERGTPSITAEQFSPRSTGVQESEEAARRGTACARYGTGVPRSRNRPPP